jgi:hypothetical protein
MAEAVLDRLPPRRQEDVALVDLLDRLLGCGAVLDGDLVLSVAGVDLVWLGLRAVLASIEHAPPGARLDRQVVGAAPPPSTARAGRTYGGDSARSTLPRLTPTRPERSEGSRPAGEQRLPAHRVDMEPDRVEQGLVRLVLSVVELLRQLMERQALRRVEDPRLSESQIEDLGMTLMRLEERMGELKEFFGLDDDDLDLRLTGVHDLT